MKKIIIVLFVFCFLVTGCFKNQQSTIVNDFEKKLSNMKGYQVEGELSVHNNDDVYNYLVKVSYKKDNFYRVEFTNTSNQHTQIILKNKEGVYVLTPSLNKSFRFQSEWPYKNSQIYLIDALFRDIIEDKDRKFEQKKNNFIFTTKVNYPNNNKLYSEKIVLDSKFRPSKVSVYDDKGIPKMVMEFKKVTYNPKFSKDTFDVDSIMELREDEKIEEAGVLEDIIYPLFLPSGTKLVHEDIVKKNNGERVIMTYDGEKSFVLVEENADVFDQFTVIPTSGEPYLLMDSLGIITDNSLSWTSSGVDYYMVSDVMSQEEMIEVAQSIGGTISIK
ncbi:MAG: outer membrane lipoprotein carrier protein LolA [Bacilli bacterium]|nr:outer membrane lipoprotein carrier protein LolA [Bacilli bacterium]